MDGDDFTTQSYVTIAVVFGTVIVTIVMLNILIAFLSNEFSRLQDEQKINDLKEKASMMLDMEVILWFFKYIITRKITKLRDLQCKFEDHNIKRMAHGEYKTLNMNDKERSLIMNRRKLCIVKTVESEEKMNEDQLMKSKQVSTNNNMNKKMNVLSENYEKLRTDYLEGQQKMDNILECIKKLNKD